MPVTLDISTSNYTKWCTLFEVAIGKFSLEDHLKEDGASATPADANWRHLDCIVLSWIYSSISHEILDIVITPTAAVATVWQTIEDIFQDNKTTQAIFLQVEFNNLAQGYMSATDYFLKLKTLFDALHDIDQSMSDHTVRQLNVTHIWLVL